MPSSKETNYRWVVLIVAFIAQTSASMVSQGAYVLAPFWHQDFGLTKSQTGLLLAAMNSGQILSMIPLGIAIDRYGERLVVSITMLAMSTVCLISGKVASNYVILVLFLVVMGAFYASAQPGGTRVILKWFKPKERGFAMGVRQAGLSLGTASAACVLPLLAVTSGWRTAAILQATVGLAGAFIFLTFHRDRDLEADRNVVRVSFREVIKMVGARSGFKTILAIGALMAGFQYTFSTFAVVYLTSVVKAELLTASSLLALTQLFGFLGRVTLVSVSDRLWPGHRMRTLRWLTMTCVGLVLMLLLLPEHASVWLLAFLFGAFGLVGIGWFPIWLLQVSENSPKEAVAATVSVAMTLNLVIIICFSPLFGFIADTGGYAVAWCGLAGALVATVIVAHRS